jgi:hypothetical protein
MFTESEPSDDTEYHLSLPGFCMVDHFDPPRTLQRQLLSEQDWAVRRRAVHRDMVFSRWAPMTETSPMDVCSFSPCFDSASCAHRDVDTGERPSHFQPLPRAKLPCPGAADFGREYQSDLMRSELIRHMTRAGAALLDQILAVPVRSREPGVQGRLNTDDLGAGRQT